MQFGLFGLIRLNFTNTVNFNQINFLHKKLIYRIDINKRVVRGGFSNFIFFKNNL